MQPDTRTGLGFGAGAQIVSEGFYVAGSANTDAITNTLYNFRQRGAAFAAVGIELMPTAVATAKAGTAVAIDGNTAVVGARDFDDRGAVFVYTANSSGQWGLSTLLQAPDGVTGDQFGGAVALSGDSLVVGAANKSGGAGAVYLYQHLGDDWAWKTTFTGSAGSRLGTAVDVYGAIAAVGAPGANQVRMLNFDGLAWTTGQTFTGTGTLAGSFGSAIAIEQDRMVVGAPTANANQGAAAAYRLNGSTWQLTQTLTAGVLGASGDRYGAAVAVSDGVIAIGTPGDAAGAGAVYTYELVGSQFTAQKVITLASAQAGDQFGAALALDHGLLLVGAWSRAVGGIQDRGAAYSYHLADIGWVLETPIDPIFASDSAAGDMVGYSVALSGQRALIGAPQLSGRPGAAIDSAGTGYAFVREVSPPSTVTVIEDQTELIAGAKANTLQGTVGGQAMADLRFFDIGSVTLATGSQADHVTVASPGLVAFGLQNFTVNTGGGDDTVTLLSDQLTPTAVGTFVPVAGTPPRYVEVTGRFLVDSGAGTDTLQAAFDTDWTLDLGLLTAGNAEQAQLARTENVQLTGGAGVNRLKVLRWTTGQVVLDGGANSDSFDVSAAALDVVRLADAAGSLDQLTLTGTTGADVFSINNTLVQLGTSVLNYAGMEVLSIAGLGGADQMTVYDSSALRVLLDGGDDGDIYRVLAGTSAADVVVHDSGALPFFLGGARQNVDTLEVPAGTPATAWRYDVGNKDVDYDDSIEVFAAPTVPDPKQSFTLSAAADTVTITGSTLRIRNGSTGQTTTTSLAQTTQLEFFGGGGDDRFVLEDVPDWIVSLVIHGEGGNDSIEGGALWQFSGAGAGTVSAADGVTDVGSFDGIEHVVATGAGQQFRFLNNTASLAGSATGTGQAVLDFGPRTGAVAVVLTGPQAGSATGVLGGFAGVGHVIGSGNVNDTLTAANTHHVWTLAGTNAGDIDGVLGFSSFAHLVGGALADSFVFDGVDRVTGSVQGGAGNNSLSWTLGDVDDTVTISATGISNGGSTPAASLSGIGAWQLFTAGGNDTVTVLGTPGTVRVDTGSGKDTIAVRATQHDLVVDAGLGDDTIRLGSLAPATEGSVADPIAALVTVQGGGGLDLLGVDDTGSRTVRDAFVDATTITGMGMAQGVVYAGIETLEVTPAEIDPHLVRELSALDDTVTVTGTTLTIHNGATGETEVFDLAPYTELSFFGLEGNDRFSFSDVPAWITAIDVHGGDGSDTLAGGALWQFDAANAGTASAADGVTDQVRFDGIENAEAGGAGQVFRFLNDSASLSGTATGTGLAALDFALRSLATAVALTGPQAGTAAGVLGGFAGVRSITAPLAATGSSLTAWNADHVWTMLDIQRAQLDGQLELFNFERLVGGSQTDTFVFDEVDRFLGALQGGLGIDGGAGEDTLQWRLHDTHDEVTLAADTLTRDTVTLTRFTGIEQLLVDTGGGSDTVTVTGTITGSTRIAMGGGDDTLRILGTTGPLSATLGTGTDTATVVLDDAALVQGALTLDGGDHEDRLVIDATAVTTGLTGQLGALGASGLGMAGGLSATSFEQWELRLGSGNDDIRVDAITVPTVIDLGGGDDRLTLGGASPLSAIATALTVQGGTGSDTLTLDDRAQTAATSGEIQAALLRGWGLGADVGYTAFEALNLLLGSGADTVTVTSTHAGSTSVDSGAGADTVEVRGNSGALDIQAGAGNDLLRLFANMAPVVLRGGADDDRFEIGSTALGLRGIVASVTVAGEDGTDNLCVLADDGGTAALAGALSATLLSGVGQAGSGIHYGTLESLALTLGAGNDSLDVTGTHAGSTSIDLGAGHDALRIGGSTGPLSAALGSGNDRATVLLDDPARVQGAITLDGGDQSDRLVIDASATTAALAGRFAANRIDGLGMAGGITHTRFEQQEIRLGGGADDITLTAVTVPTTIDLGGGDDRLTLGGTTTPLSAFAAALSVQGGAGNDTLTLDARLLAAHSAGEIQSALLRGFGLGSDVAYAGIETLAVLLGSGANTVTVRSTHAGTTRIDTGAGNDTVDVRGSTGVLDVQAGAGKDAVRLRASGAGAVTLRGGADNDSFVLGDPERGGLRDILGPVRVDGEAGTDSLQVLAGEECERDPLTGTLSATRITGLGQRGTNGVDYAGLESLGIALGDGNDTLTVTGTHAGSTRVEGNGGNDRVNLSAHTGEFDFDGGSGYGNTLLLDLAARTDALRVALDACGVSGLASGGASPASGKVTYDDLALLRLVTGSGADTLVVDGTHSGRTEIDTGAGADNVTIVDTCGELDLATGDSADTVVLRAASAAVGIRLGAGDDHLTLGNPGRNGGATLNGIAGKLSVQGDGGNDTLVVDDSADTAANSGVLGANSLTGFGLRKGLSYAGMELLDMRLGSGSDQLAIIGTHAGKTRIDAGAGNDVVTQTAANAGELAIAGGAGNDTINIRASRAALAIDGGSGDDSVNLGSLVPTTRGGVAAGLAGPITVEGGSGRDTMRVDDSGNSVVLRFNLTSNALTGLGMAQGVRFSGLEKVEVTPATRNNPRPGDNDDDCIDWRDWDDWLCRDDRDPPRNKGGSGNWVYDWLCGLVGGRR
jgi:hypothetical protein